MPCIWGRHNGTQLFCAVAILPPIPVGSSVPGAAPASYTGPSGVVNALIDTGAMTTGIASQLAAQLQLQPIGKVQIQGVGGVQHHNSHLFRVGFPFVVPSALAQAQGLPTPLPGQMHAQVFVLEKVIQGCEFASGSARFQVILGMDVLATGSLVVQGDQTFSFSF